MGNGNTKIYRASQQFRKKEVRADVVKQLRLAKNVRQDNCAAVLKPNSFFRKAAFVLKVYG